MNLFNQTVRRENFGRPPIWLMRQAGRYHSHYQKLKETYSFIELCKIPEAACETTMGPIRDFDFDAAIMFSDLLFPLEAMGMGLEYSPGPKMGWHIKSVSDLKKLHKNIDASLALKFQADALRLIRKALPQEKGLLGFVGGPLTLFFYAAEGSHAGTLENAKEGLNDGRYEGFFEILCNLLVDNMVLQAKAGADTVAVLDTCAGEISPQLYKEKVVPTLKKVFDLFQVQCPNTPITYYSKKTGPEHWNTLNELPIACKGIDWNHDLSEVLTKWSDRWAIQGNIDPNWLFLESIELETKLREVWGKVKSLPPRHRAGWICGLGHGVLPKTPEENVKLFVKISREMFG